MHGIARVAALLGGARRVVTARGRGDDCGMRRGRAHRLEPLQRLSQQGLDGRIASLDLRERAQRLRRLLEDVRLGRLGIELLQAVGCQRGRQAETGGARGGRLTGRWDRARAPKLVTIDARSSISRGSSCRM